MPADDFRPDVDEVAAVLASRTYTKETVSEADGNLAGTFNENTRPTADQAERLIDQAMTEIAPRVVDNDDTSDEVYALAKTTVARRAALLILISFFEEDLEQASSGVDEVERLYKEALETLEAIQPDSATSARGIVSVPMRSPVLGALERGELLGSSPELLP